MSEPAHLARTAKLGQIADYLAPENWSREIPGLNRLHAYLRKIDRAGRTDASVGLVEGPDDIPEIAAAASLIWYLDSGGRRNYVITGRPDQVDRTRPSPDFILEDQTTGHEIALEVTSVFRAKDVVGALPLKRHVASFLNALLNKNGHQVPLGGLFDVVLGNGTIRGASFEQAVADMASAVLTAASTTKEVAEEQVLDQGFRIRLIRRTARDPGEPGEFLVNAEEDYDRIQRALEMKRRLSLVDRLLDGRPDTLEEPGAGQSTSEWPPKWEVPEDTAEAMRRCLSEADSKFSHCYGIECALLVQLNLVLLFDEPLVYLDWLSMLSAHVQRVHRLYVMFENDYTTQWMIARVW